MDTDLPTARDGETLALACELCDLAAHTHAGLARIARLAAKFDTAGGWTGAGMRSCAQWLSISAGFDLRSSAVLVSVGHALENLPLIARAFEGGELSLDKVRALCTVARPADEEVWLEVAREASGAQLTRLVRACRRALEAAHPDAAVRARARRGLWSYWDDDGTLRLRGVLTPEDGAKLCAALEGVQRASAADGDPAEDRVAARRADALITLCDRALAGGADGGGERPLVVPGLVVHVDAALLTGADPEGRCHLDGGPGLPASVARCIGCDTEVIAITERDGLPIDVGRARYVVPTPLRRALRERDRFCRYPGCPVLARHTHAHHLVHWLDGGPTDLDNLASLCGHHHRRVHDGEVRIVRDAGGELRFLTAAGTPITVLSQRLDESMTDPVALRCGLVGEGLMSTLSPSTPRARDGGAPFHMDYAVGVVLDACEFRLARAAPDG
jgi:hypothetical protein